MGEEKQTFDETDIEIFLRSCSSFITLLKVAIMLSSLLALTGLFYSLTALHSPHIEANFSKVIILIFSSLLLLYLSLNFFFSAPLSGKFEIFTQALAESHKIQLHLLPSEQKKILFKGLMDLNLICENDSDSALRQFGLQKEDFTGSNV